MKKALLCTLLLLVACASLYSQLMVTKMIGKNSSESRLGYGLFAFYDFSLRNAENESIRLELMDLAFFPTKSDSNAIPIGYISIKIGFKYTFSDTKTGFYIEPQAGYCRVVSNDPNNLSTQTSYGDGVALALEVGYSLEIGQRGHMINFGIKYEDDIAGSPNTMSSVGFRVSYTFNMFKRRDSY